MKKYIIAIALACSVVIAYYILTYWLRTISVAIAFFCLFMTSLTVCNCWLKPENKYYKFAASLIAIGTGITGFIVLLQMMPTPASPQINDIYFYGEGSTNKFRYCCEFLARNDGATQCLIDKVEFIMFCLRRKWTKPFNLLGCKNDERKSRCQPSENTTVPRKKLVFCGFIWSRRSPFRRFVSNSV